MPINTFLVHDVTIVYPGYSTDRYGNLAKNWSTATSVETLGWFNQRNTVEDDNQREGTETDAILFLEPDETISEFDRVIFREQTYEVFGKPKLAGTPRGTHHLEIDLKLYQG
jgi:hypothetical protein